MLTQRNGVWYLDMRVNGKRTRLSLETSDKAVAMQRAAAKLAAQPSSPATVPAGPTLRAAFRAAMRTRAEWRDAKDQDGLSGTFDQIVARFGEDKPVNLITEGDVLDWIDFMVAKKQAPSTINRKLSMLSVLCKEAGYAPPKMPRMTVRKGRIRVLTDNEVMGMLGAMPRNMEPLVLVLLHTACRLSEALNLKWRDVDLEGRTMAVWENKASHPRILPLSAVAHRALDGLKGNGLAGPFADLTVHYCDGQWSKARKLLGLADDRQFVIHALRHTSLSRLAAAGVDAARIQKFAGHKQISTTMGYVHLNPESIRDLACVQDRVGTAAPARDPIVPRFVNAPVSRTHNPSVPGSTPGGPTNNLAPAGESARSLPDATGTHVGPEVGLNPDLRPYPRVR